MKWYYAQGGSQKGPINGGELRAKIASGEVSSGDLVWREGMKDWLPASEVAELSSYAPEPAEAGNQFGAPVQSAAVSEAPARSASVSPYQAPQGVAGPIPGSGKATTAMVLGIVSTVIGLCGCYGMIISLPCGIIAIIFGNDILKKMKTNAALEPERGKAKAGVILGWIGIGINILFTVLMLLLGVVGAMQDV